MWKLRIFSLFLLFSCAGGVDFKTVDELSLLKYQGKWFEIARIEHSFEAGCANVTATYTIVSDREFDITNFCYNGKKVTTINGTAYLKKGEVSRFLASFPPFTSSYNVAFLDKDYTYAMIYGENRNFLWIIARKKTLNSEDYNNLLRHAAKDGFDVTRLTLTKQY